MLFCESNKAPPEFSGESTITTQIIRSNLHKFKKGHINNENRAKNFFLSECTHLTACMMPQICPVHLELTHVIHMNEFMRNCALHMLLAEKIACA